MKKNNKKGLQPTFKRAALDRNLACNPKPFREAIDNLNLKGLAILDFGCGKGFLEHLLKNSEADVIYAFEVLEDEIDDKIKAWARDRNAKPRLIINPDRYMIDPNAPRGDLTNYDYFKLLEKHDKFAIISNPPYFLYNRILSLTGQNLAPEDAAYKKLGRKFAGALMITSETRLQNHPGWNVVDKLPGTDFDPPAANIQYLMQTGFKGRIKKATFLGRVAHNSRAQRYVGINNRNPAADSTDHYPEMWKQLNKLNRKP